MAEEDMMGGRPQMGARPPVDAAMDTMPPMERPPMPRESMPEQMPPEAVERLMQPSEEIGAVLVARLSNMSPNCLLYTSPSPRDGLLSRMPSSA